MKNNFAKLNILLAALTVSMLVTSCSFIPGSGPQSENADAADSAITATQQPEDAENEETENEDAVSGENAQENGKESESGSSVLTDSDDSGEGEGTEDLSDQSENDGSKDSADEEQTDISPCLGTGLEDTGLLYAYNLLSDEDKKEYVIILSSLINREDKALLTFDKEKADYIYNCVMADHPELFYIDGYTVTTHSCGDELTSMTISGNYSLDESKQKEYEEQMKPVIAECLSMAPSEGDYEKIKYVYEYVIGNTDYSAGAEHNQTIVSVFLNHTSVCNGYSKAVQYLLQRLGVETVFVTGNAKGSGHAWNMVMADGSWYYVDATWGDASYIGSSTEKMWISYDYLCVTTQDLCDTHAFSNIISLPKCVDRADNYYIRENAWFDSFDEGRFTELVQQGKENDGVIRLRCGNSAVYDEIGQKLITDKGIYDYIGEDSSISYIKTKDMMTYTFLINSAG